MDVRSLNHLDYNELQAGAEVCYICMPPARVVQARHACAGTAPGVWT